MKLAKTQIEELARIILKDLKVKELISLNASEDLIIKKMTDIIVKDLRVEDDIDKEVEGMLEKYRKDFESGKMEYRKMFNILKEKLVNERELVI